MKTPNVDYEVFANGSVVIYRGPRGEDALETMIRSAGKFSTLELCVTYWPAGDMPRQYNYPITSWYSLALGRDPAHLVKSEGKTS